MQINTPATLVGPLELRIAGQRVKLGPDYSIKAASHAAALWRCFDRGSWVAPQLAVSLYCSDPVFAERAKERTAARCPIIDDDGFFEGQTQPVSAKNLASLLRVVAYTPGRVSAQ